MEKIEAVAREIAYQDGISFDSCNRMAQRRYRGMADALITAMEPCFSCGRNVWQPCPRADETPCGREHHGGSREPVVR